MNLFWKGLLASLLVHSLVGALVFALPADRVSKQETISIDFTLTEQETAPGLRGGATSSATPQKATTLKSDKAPLTRSGKTDQRDANRKKETLENQRDQYPGADPAQSEDVIGRYPNAREDAAGIPSSPEGAPVAEKQGTPAVGGAGGSTSVAKLEHPRSSYGGAGEASGGGQGALLREIRDSVLRTVMYPERARRMGSEGRVILSFTVYEDGSIHDSRIVQSSGAAILDDAAQDALRRSTIRSQFSKKIQVLLPIDYRLK